MSLESINPFTGVRIRAYPEMPRDEVDAVLDRAKREQRRWAATSFAERAACLRRAARLLRESAGDCARLMAEEMGKPVTQGVAEIDKCAWVSEYYAANAERFLRDEAVPIESGSASIAYRPLGTVLAVMPWNFPFWQVFRFAAPTLMAGNAALLKHASNVQGCALSIEEILHRAGVPRPVFRTIPVPGARVESLIADDRIAAVTLTGSTDAGRSVGVAAGKAIKKSVLELGGSDPYLVLEDADLESAVEACVSSRLINAGQSCIAAKRFVVVASVAEEFRERMVASMRSKTVGDPLRPVDVGPLARTDLRDQLHAQVQASLDSGARLLLGGELPPGGSALYPPTVLDGVRPGMLAYEEETFGPVASILEVRDEEQAIEVANDTVFGLGAAVFTRDRERGERIARDRLEAGCCFVNDFVRSDPRVPFGGVKQSGYGRELGRHGIHEFVNAKTVRLA